MEEMTYKEAQSRAARARFAKMTPDERKELARKAINARWDKYRAENGKPVVE